MTDLLVAFLVDASERKCRSGCSRLTEAIPI
jgi:hypothetical protein